MDKIPNWVWQIVLKYLQPADIYQLAHTCVVMRDIVYLQYPLKIRCAQTQEKLLSFSAKTYTKSDLTRKLALRDREIQLLPALTTESKCYPQEAVLALINRLGQNYVKRRKNQRIRRLIQRGRYTRVFKHNWNQVKEQLNFSSPHVKPLQQKQVRKMLQSKKFDRDKFIQYMQDQERQKQNNANVLKHFAIAMDLNPDVLQEIDPKNPRKALNFFWDKYIDQNQLQVGETRGRNIQEAIISKTCHLLRCDCEKVEQHHQLWLSKLSDYQPVSPFLNKWVVIKELQRRGLFIQ